MKKILKRFQCAVATVGPSMTVSISYVGVFQTMLMNTCVCDRVGESERLTFVSDEVSAEDDEEAEQDEDDNSHHPSNHSVVHS